MTENSMIERVEVLERQNRRMWRIGAGVIFVAGAMLLMGQAPAARTIVDGWGHAEVDPSQCEWEGWRGSLSSKRYVRDFVERWQRERTSIPLCLQFWFGFEDRGWRTNTRGSHG